MEVEKWKLDIKLEKEKVEAEAQGKLAAKLKEEEEVARRERKQWVMAVVDPKSGRTLKGRAWNPKSNKLEKGG